MGLASSSAVVVEFGQPDMNAVVEVGQPEANAVGAPTCPTLPPINLRKWLHQLRVLLWREVSLP